MTRQLIPSGADSEALPDPLVEDGEPLSVSEAATTYMKLEYHALNKDDYTSRYEYARYYQYPKILESDRTFQTEFGDALTTCLITRRVSPFAEPTGSAGSNAWLTPWEINEMLNGGGIRRSIRQALDYHLGGFPDFQWCAVTTPDETHGTPYELLYLWVDDPENSVEVGHLEPALERHLDRCAGALEEDHNYRADGTDGALQIQHSPEIVSEPPEKLTEVFSKSKAGDGDEPRSLLPTTGALHLAKNLPDLVVGDYFNSSKRDPSERLIEGAAVGYAVPHNWVRFSEGVPSLD